MSIKNSSSLEKNKINSLDIVYDTFSILNTKEKEIVIRRFDIDGKGHYTLEKIGKKLSLTRERVRQIQFIALSKLSKTIRTTVLFDIINLITKVLRKNGGIMKEELLVAKVLNKMKKVQILDGQIIKFLLAINNDLEKRDKNNNFYKFWYLSEISMVDIKTEMDLISETLLKNGNIMTAKDVAGRIFNMSSLGKKTQNYEIGKYFMKIRQDGNMDKLINMTENILAVDKKFRKTSEGKWGFVKWRHVNPRSICDKVYVTMKKHGEPMHFIEITNKIIDEGFDTKSVTVQSVHNELIRFDSFVLVGRGLYALKEWGYADGTVTDIIEDALKKNKNNTAKKQEIVNWVLNQRNVKPATISLSLQKNPHFVRIGRAVYQLDLSLKPKQIKQSRGSRRKKKQRRIM